MNSPGPVSWFHVTSDEDAIHLSVSAPGREPWQARIPWAWAVRNSRQVGPVRRGAGSRPAVVRIRQTVEAPTR